MAGGAPGEASGAAGAVQDAKEVRGGDMTPKDIALPFLLFLWVASMAAVVGAFFAGVWSAGQALCWLAALIEPAARRKVQRWLGDDVVKESKE
jgi:hypothetical protein